jgi:hypothetical protein
MKPTTKSTTVICLMHFLFRMISSPLLFNFTLEYAIRKEGMEHISSWSMLTMLIRILGENINTINKNKDQLETNKEIGPEVNREKTKYMVASC